MFVFSFINRHRGLYCGLYWFRRWVPQKSGHWKWLHRCLVCGHTHTPGALSETWHCIWLETRTCLCDDRQESVKGMFIMTFWGHIFTIFCFCYSYSFLCFLVFLFATKRFNYNRETCFFYFSTFNYCTFVKNLSFFAKKYFHAILHAISSVSEKVSGHNL